MTNYQKKKLVVSIAQVQTNNAQVLVVKKPITRSHCAVTESDVSVIENSHLWLQLTLMFQMCESTKQAIEEELESTLKKKDESNDDDDDVDITEL